MLGSRRWSLAGSELVRLQLASFWKQGRFQRLEGDGKGYQQSQPEAKAPWAWEVGTMSCPSEPAFQTIPKFKRVAEVQPPAQ